MPEPTKFSLSDAALADGTIDFYNMLGEGPDTPVDQLKAKIHVLYSEAQANRDHRNLSKRREYQALLELLPGARSALLDVEKRQRYDAYLAAAKAGTNTPEFEEFMNDLMGLNEEMEEKTGLLGVQERSAEPKARVIKTTTPAKAPSKAAPAVKSSPDGPPPMAIGAAIGGFVIGLVIGVAMHKIIVGVLLGIVLGAILYVALSGKQGNKVGR